MPHHHHRTPAPRRAVEAAFTLVELLVVVGIIAILIAILMPALRRARDSANEVACASNQRQLMMAFLMFAGDHRQHLPGNFTDFANPDADKRAWLLNAGQPFDAAPEGGTIFKYLKSHDVYRCPAVPADAVRGSYGSSNGQFDYVSFGVFTGAKLVNIKAQSKYTDLTTNRWEMKPTPVICEEDLRSLNVHNMEGLHNYGDRLADNHRKGGNYASIDGSVHWHQETVSANGTVRNGAHSWSQIGPRGRLVSLGEGGYGITWGWWNAQ